MYLFQIPVACILLVTIFRLSRAGIEDSYYVDWKDIDVYKYKESDWPGLSKFKDRNLCNGTADSGCAEFSKWVTEQFKSKVQHHTAVKNYSTCEPDKNACQAAYPICWIRMKAGGRTAVEVQFYPENGKSHCRYSVTEMYG
uniref:Secreted protein n=1 Tax=Cacopsylla melanoneura TaxID=428564 RepID=A0A8D8Y4V8_9HEMI